MISLRRLAVWLLLAASAAFSRGFSSNPTPITVDANVSFDIGQAAVNSFLYEAFKTPVSYGSGATRVVFSVKRAEVVFAGNAGTLYLDMTVHYDLQASPKMARITETRPLTSGSFAYFYGTGLSLVLGNLPLSTAVPSYVTSAVAAKFGSLRVYPGEYQGTVTGLSGTTAIGSRAQVDELLPIWYMAGGSWAVSFVNGLLRVTMGPTLEREKPRIQFYRRTIGTPIGATWSEVKSEMSVITNFKGTLRKVGYICSGSVGHPCTRYQSCIYGPPCDYPMQNGDVTYTGPFEMSKETSGDTRYRRYNYVAPLVMDRHFYGEVGFWVEIQHGSIRYLASAWIPHNTNGYGGGHGSFYPTVNLYYNY